MRAASGLVVAGVQQATAYISALGVYELHINGQRIGDRVLAPEWTDYTRRVQYQSYDALWQHLHNAPLSQA